ncbi:unnamed protein product [Rhizopus stolonifer]
MSKAMLRKYRKAVEEYSDDDIMSNNSLSKRPKFGQKRSKKNNSTRIQVYCRFRPANRSRVVWNYVESTYVFKIRRFG